MSPDFPGKVVHTRPFLSIVRWEKVIRSQTLPRTASAIPKGFSRPGGTNKWRDWRHLIDNDRDINIAYFAIVIAAYRPFASLRSSHSREIRL